MKKYAPLFFTFLIAPFFAFAQMSAGIPDGGIWFSKEPFFAGEKISVSTVVFNATKNEIKGTLEFFDAGTLIEKKEVTLNAGENKIISFDFVVTEGKHTFSIKVLGGDFTLDSGNPINLSAKGNDGNFIIETSKVLLTVAKDTDSDGISDVNDKDIDGDSLSNDAEKKLGTDPKIPDTDGDGILDAADKNPLKFDKLPSVTDPITSVDTQKVADKVEKIIPSSVVTPVFNVATPVIGKIESVRVGVANKNSDRIDNSIDSIIGKVGTTKILGINSTGSASSSAGEKTFTGKPSGWQVFKNGVTGENFGKSPFDYIKLFLFILVQFILSHTLIFYIVLILIIFKILLYIKRLIFNRNE